MKVKSASSTLITPAIAIGLLGAVFYFALIFRMLPGPNLPQFGEFIYNYYFLSLLEGRFDIPTRIASFEGHYSSDGRAFIYYGLAPLITRIFAWPLFDLKTVSLTAPTIYLFATLGTAIYHFLFVSILQRCSSKDNPHLERFGLFLGAMVWFASPGLILCSSGSVYNEPIAAAYFFTASFIFLLAKVIFFGARLSKVLFPLSLAAGLALHARPHLAVGLYAGVCLASLVAIRREGWPAVYRAALAMFTLLFFGVILLGVNEARFGSALQSHGLLQGSAEVQYGFIFWGLETSDSPRMKAFIEHGVFNLYRLLPNLMLYLFDLPWEPIASWMEGVYRHITDGLGYIRIAHPRIGVVYMWLPWFALIAVSYRPDMSPVSLIAVASVLTGAIFLAAYGTVTFRYRVDLWPAVAMLSLFSVSRAPQQIFSSFTPVKLVISSALLFAILFGVFATLLGALGHRTWHAQAGWASPITVEQCEKMYADKGGFETKAVDRFCSL